MIQGLAALLLCQSIGEVIARWSHAPVPGPVIALLLLMAALVLRQRRDKPTWVPLEQAADALLAHLSIFFVPAAVGVMLYWEPLAREGPTWMVAIVASTVAAIAVTAWVLERLLGAPSDEDRAP